MQACLSAGVFHIMRESVPELRSACVLASLCATVMNASLQTYLGAGVFACRRDTCMCAGVLACRRACLREVELA
jgi:hypothetical protein